MAPRDRKPGLAALAVLLIVGGALLTVTLVLRSGGRVSAVEISQRVGAGQAIPLSALKEVQIAEDGPAFVYWSAAPNLTDYYAAVDLVPGTLLNESMLSKSSAELVPGKAVVGLSLKSSQMPPNLQAGQRVQVVYVPDNDGTPRVLSRNALVNSVSGGDTSTGSGNVTVAVVVGDNVSPVIAGYASAGRIALAYLPGAKAPTQPDVVATPTATPTTGSSPAAGGTAGRTSSGTTTGGAASKTQPTGGTGTQTGTGTQSGTGTQAGNGTPNTGTGQG
jgi:hypothetical protein